MPISTSHRLFTDLRKKRGLTLIELIVVLAIIGSVMALGLQVLRSFWKKESTGVTPLEFVQLLNLAREKSISKGGILSLSINLEKKSMELKEYDPASESMAPAFPENPARQSQIENQDQGNEADQTGKKPAKKKEPLFRGNLPSEIDEFYAPSGIKLPGPILYLHFYPDGTEDAIIIKYKNREKPFQFIPRNGGQGTFMSDLNMTAPAE